MPLTKDEIAKANDKFRSKILRGIAKDTEGKAIVTKTILETLTTIEQIQAFAKVIKYDDFNKDNDPYGTHEFGTFEFKEHQIMWQIDNFENEECLYGHPEDSDEPGYKILTICFLHER